MQQAGDPSVAALSASMTKDSALAASCGEPLAAGRVGRTPRGGSTQSVTPRGLGLAGLQEEVRLVEIAQGTRVRYCLLYTSPSPRD